MRRRLPVRLARSPAAAGRALLALGSLVPLLAFSGPTGCAARAGGAAAAETRFRGDLAGLERLRDWSLDELYERPGLDLGAFERIHVASVALAPDLDSGDETYRDVDLALVQRSFRTSLIRALEDGYSLADAPGAGVLRVHATLTALRANRRPLDRGPGPTGPILNRSLGVGRAAMQLELRDGADGRLLLAAVDRYQGQDFATNLQLDSTWGDARHAFRRWARLLRDRLDRDS